MGPGIVEIPRASLKEKSLPLELRTHVERFTFSGFIVPVVQQLLRSVGEGRFSLPTLRPFGPAALVVELLPRVLKLDA